MERGRPKREKPNLLPHQRTRQRKKRYPHSCERYLPSQAEIRQLCLIIQTTWSEDERWKRAIQHPIPWDIPIIREEDLNLDPDWKAEL